MELGRRLRMLRRAKGLSQAQLGQEIEVHQMTIRRWETGERFPNAEDLLKLSEALGTSPSELIGDGGEQPGAASFGVRPREQNSSDMSYWGGVVDCADDVVMRGDEKELTRVRRMLDDALCTVENALEEINRKKLAG